MRKVITVPSSLLVLGGLSILLVAQIVHKSIPDKNTKGFLPPLPRKEIVKVSSMEFRPLLSDYYLVKAATLYGGNKLVLSPMEVKWVAKSLALSLALDPYYFEPYLFAGNVLPWCGGADLVIPLLKEGLQYRHDDWRIPFYLGFIYFYFKKDRIRGAHYLSLAARLPSAPSYLPLLATRLYSQAGRFSPAITYLRSLYRNTKDPKLKSIFQKRLKALTIMATLERLAQEYKELYGRFPGAPEDLAKAGLLRRVPSDPYGGRFYFKKDGTVWSTSRLREVKKR